MTTSLLKEIRDGIVESGVEISTLLRKAKILAVTLGNEDFKQWTSNELDGYAGTESVPDYRKVPSPVLGTFSGPFGQRIEGYLLPVSLMPDFLQEQAGPLCFMHSIKKIEGMSRSDGDSLKHLWMAEAVMLLRDKIRLSGDFVLVEAYQPVHKADLESIIDAVRNRLLDLLLSLQEIAPSVLESDDTLLKLPKETIRQVFHVSIYGDHNVLASGSGITQAVGQDITPFDKVSLFSALRIHGVTGDDLEELDIALRKDEPKPKDRVGRNVRMWLEKAASGTWSTALKIAPEILTKALSAYYGWNR